MKRKGKNTTAEERQLAPESPNPLAGPPTEPMPRTQLTIQRPKTSPYSSPIVTLYIGLSKREYYVRRDLLQCPEWINSCSGRAHPSIRMPTVDEDIGHVLVHYLHNGTYQTLDNIDNVTADKGCVEFKRAVLAYFTAKTYGLDGLQQLAMENIKHYGMEMTTFDIFDMINQEFPEFLEKSGWLYDYLKEKAKAAFEGDYILLVQSDILHRISNVELNRIMFKCVVELYIASRTSKNKVDCIEDGPSGEALVDEALVNAAERKKKEEGAEAGRMKRQEKEAVAAALVATGAANDLSWADPPAEAAPADDGWGSFTPAATAGKKKKGKKGKQVTETVPVPPTGPELEPYTADPATTFDNNDLDGGAPASGLGGLGTWTSGIGSGWGVKASLTSGWNFDGGFGLGSKEEEKNKDEAPGDPTEKKGREGLPGSRIDFSLDAFNDPITNSDPTAVEEKPAEDDGWGSGFGSKSKTKTKTKTGSNVIVPIVEFNPEPTPERPKDDWSSYTFGNAATTIKKKKGEKGAATLIEETPPPPLEPAPVLELPAPEPVKEDESFGWGAVAAVGGKKKKKKGAIAEIKEEPKVEEPLPPPLAEPEPEPVPEPLPVDDGWGSFATPVVKKKKGKKGAKEDPGIAPEPVKEPEPEPEPIPEAVPEPEPVAEVKKDGDLWGESFWGAPAAATTVKKKKGKKGAKEDPKVEELPPLPPLEPEPEPTPVVEADDGWGTAAAVVPKKGKKAKKGSIAAAAPDPPKEVPLIEVALLAEPVVEPPLDDGWGSFATPATTTTKKSKSKKVVEEPPPPSSSPVIPDPEPDPPSAPSAECIPAPSDSTFTRLGTAIEGTKGPENAVCLNRARHLLEGDTWKNCRQFRAVLRQVAVQLAVQVHENGYEMVDHLLME